MLTNEEKIELEALRKLTPDNCSMGTIGSFVLERIGELEGKEEPIFTWRPAGGDQPVPMKKQSH